MLGGPMRKKLLFSFIVILTLLGLYFGAYKVFNIWCWGEVNNHFGLERPMGSGYRGQKDLNLKMLNHIQSRTPLLYFVFGPVIRRDRYFPGRGITVYRFKEVGKEEIPQDVRDLLIKSGAENLGRSEPNENKGTKKHAQHSGAAEATAGESSPLPPR